MTCEGCAKPQGGVYITDCLDCMARIVANAPRAHLAAMGKKIVEKMSAIEADAFRARVKELKERQ